MLRLRPYKPGDANSIINWCPDERSFRLWCSDRYDSFPISPSDINNKYFDWNGDCVENDNFYPMTATDEHKTVCGHLVMRYMNGDPDIIRLGWIIIDNNLRGQGLGKEMIQLALKYAFQILQAKKISIGVFDSNMQAYNCYISCGFKDVAIDQMESFAFNNEKWTILELELTKEDYENRNSRKTIFSDLEKSEVRDVKPKKIKNNSRKSKLK